MNSDDPHGAFVKVLSPVERRLYFLAGAFGFTLSIFERNIDAQLRSNNSLQKPRQGVASASQQLEAFRTPAVETHAVVEGCQSPSLKLTPNNKLKINWVRNLAEERLLLPFLFSPLALSHLLIHSVSNRHILSFRGKAMRIQLDFEVVHTFGHLESSFEREWNIESAVIFHCRVL